MAYYWKLPTWAKKADCKIEAEALGKDYANAKARCDDVLNPQLDAWRKGETVSPEARVGTLKWLVEIFKEDEKFSSLGSLTQRDYQSGFELITSYSLKNGRRFGETSLKAVTPIVIDKIYKKLSARSDGSQRRTTVNKAMRAMRRAWNVMYRRYPNDVPKQNPFAKMDLRSSGKETYAASRQQLWDFVKAADALGYPSMGTAAMLAFEWLLRETDIISKFSWLDYRPPERPDAVRLRHGKTKQVIWQPLTDVQGNLLFPELTERLEAMPRRGPLVIMRDHLDKNRKNYLPYKRFWFSELSRKIRKVAELPDALSFSSFRHGGLTELGDARIDDQGMMALSAHKTRAMLNVYSKRTEDQRIQAAQARLQYRLNHLK